MYLNFQEYQKTNQYLGYLTGKEMANITNANLHSKYDMSEAELRVLNSDGRSCIKKL